MLIKKFKQIVQKEFNFLLNYGFNERQIDYGPLEQNIVFKQKHWTISICYYEGLTKNYKKSNFVDVIIKYDLNDLVSTIPIFGIVEFNQIRANLVSCDKLFGKEKINQLKRTLMDTDIEKQICIQAAFLKNNIESLNLDV